MRAQTNKRLKRKLGTKRTLCKSRKGVNWIVPIWVIEVVTPVGSVTLESETCVKEVK